jgi:hypothetical protein
MKKLMLVPTFLSDMVNPETLEHFPVILTHNRHA